MNYVKHFSINGIDTKQVACIELNGRPNAATEGAVGVLGIDVTSPTHDVYKCVAVNGSIYSWELLSSGMSIICATIAGEGVATKSFPYSSLLLPEDYLVKKGDLILDSDGYLYQISTLGAESCDTSYTGNFLGGAGGSDRELALVDGQLQLVAPGGTVINTIDYLLPDGSTIIRDSETGIGAVHGIYTIGGTQLKLFRGTHEEYNALSYNEKVNLFPIFTDDAYVTQATVDDIKSGKIIVKNAIEAQEAEYAEAAEVAVRAKSDSNGSSIVGTYATKADLQGIVSGSTVVGKAEQANSALMAVKDGSNNTIASTYATNTKVDNILNGTTPVKKAETADSATTASRDSSGDIIATKYATRLTINEIKSGDIEVGRAKQASSAGTATFANAAERDGYSQVISETYATNTKVDNVINGATPVNKAVEAEYATQAGQAASADTATNANHAASADTATNANHAASADTATNANHAASADSAKSADSATNANYAMRAGTAGSAASADMATKATQDEYGNNIYENYTRNGDTVRYIGDISPNVSTGLYTYGGSFDNIDGKEYSDVIGVSFEIEVTWGSNTRNIPVVAFWGGASTKERFCYLPFVHYEAVTSSTTYYRPYMICFLLRFMSTAITIPSPILLDLQDVSATSGAASISRSLGKMKKLTVYYK